MILLIIIAIFLIIIVSLLFLPIVLVINTETNNYYIKLNGFFKAWLQTGADFSLKMQILFFRTTLKPEKMKRGINSHKPGSFLRKINKRSIRVSLRELLKLVKIIKLDAAVDTGDYPVNALLIPVAQTLNNNTINIEINFQNVNHLDFIAETRIYKLIILYINLFIITKK